MAAAIMTEEKLILEGQIREFYGRVVYTHKTHEKCADLLLARHKHIKLLQIILSALVTGGVLAALLPRAGLAFTLITAILSTLLLALNSYTKDYDLGEVAQKHRQAAAEVWLIRERYLSLLTDLRCNAIGVKECRELRDRLLLDLGAVYTGAPSTNAKAYRAAHSALKNMDEMTFSDVEIDKFLPKELRRTAS
ncbi:SLATT domain-containing protein [Xanthomonas oryzae]|uniref:SLATT domain-containing protein n=1 Tax=Xanthomonas oryzae TaxID=347 RepID=UPI0006AC88C2|nr:SLATT domain-containing protein [Xanthomonas oryzae]QBG92235.1 SLATT domain-containing protein [Xanthomonas oryzae]QGH66211.1 SLATT domain-containing protein [Xanthomonas oryzae pv. oryzicola]